jgi:hypothetical protein
MVSRMNEKELWVGFARDAMSSYVAPDNLDDNEDQVDDMVELASGYSDAMLDEYEGRFGDSGGSKRRKTKSRKTKMPPDDDED